MGLLDLFRGKDSARPEEELRRLVVNVSEVLRETEEIIDALPPELRQGARRSFDESVGESIGDCRKRLVLASSYPFAIIMWRRKYHKGDALPFAG